MSRNQKRQLYTSLLYMAHDFQEYPQKLLSGLGKPTKRGIKKCIHCGVFNGTRSTVCKNKQCNRVLKNSEDKSKTNLEAVKLLTNTEKQVYSVKIWDMGPDYRGFVQLPLLLSCSDQDSSIYGEVAICFVDSCQNSFDNSILKCHEEETNSNNTLCTHIKSALKSENSATPIKLNPNILNSFDIREEIKKILLKHDNEKEGPLVQKVSKSVMAVKCQVNAKHPLGYLHFTFIKGKGKDTFEKFSCSCSEFIVSERCDDELSANKQKCLHYYACIWALASDYKDYDEFSTFLRCELSTEGINKISDNVISKSVEIPISNKIVVQEKSNDLNINSIILKKRVKKSELRRKKETIKCCKKLTAKMLPIEIKVLDDTPKSTNSVTWDFVDWLSFVTESINGTMQFENYGIVNTIVLQIPADFYNCLAKRIPNMYEVLQTGNCFGYYIMNILHLKEIFDTSKMKLKISKKFVHNDQKGYVEFDENEENNDSTYQCPFIYFLNVGQSTVDESDNTNNSFYIEWTPSLFSVSNIGQLRLQYKYGRKST